MTAGERRLLMTRTYLRQMNHPGNDVRPGYARSLSAPRYRRYLPTHGRATAWHDITPAADMPVMDLEPARG
jgi:hypothetical protein